MASTDVPAERTDLTPATVQTIVLRTTPANPSGPVEPDTALRKLGIVDDETAGVHKAGIQRDLNRIGWRIKQAEIKSSPTATVADCRDSVLGHAF